MLADWLLDTLKQDNVVLWSNSSCIRSGGRGFETSRRRVVCLYFFCRVTSLKMDSSIALRHVISHPSQMSRRGGRGRKDVQKNERSRSPGDTRRCRRQKFEHTTSRVRATGFEKGRFRSRMTWREYCKTAMEHRIINTELSYIVCNA